MSLRLFLATLQFMTRIPVPSRWTQGVEIDQYVRGIASFPLVGLIVGVLASAVFTLLAPWSGAPLAALAYVLAQALLTGALHLDGLADTCDGVFSARKRERMLEIMRDSRLGTNGGLALILLILAKVLVVSELSLRGASMLMALTAASVAGRSAIILLMYRQRCAREGSGLGNLYIGRVNGYQTLLTLLGGAILIVLLMRWSGVLALAITLLVIGLLAMYLHRRLGGQTGDTLGASVEVGELVFLLALL
ncbi:adenosylcobinamide-GDP ribazoletransferase [Photorhabdus laumondii]|uniref:Adenosylcobinamide-GDP ribazoletransferase n=1 Tax=Photorhabdus laumondii subsp. clarkei TaxID=2029685 RepID=A0A329VDF9_9GAMM|nr:adenosylcobinamide-GDP ribazoletransferase [Photorhabdus laumondii]PQQ38048.1 adenosylcobinamide-GDP ribazoletransferase [Photorhabdus luminescens]RAW88382.1 adenosylcobinamide-GDP ribazoletransferase [Photorhabdus laumondii subsp. clarkei]